jgi:hypothetical protein
MLYTIVLHAMSCVVHVTLRLYINPLRELRSLIILLLLLLQLHYTATNRPFCKPFGSKHVSMPRDPKPYIYSWLCSLYALVLLLALDFKNKVVGLPRTLALSRICGMLIA